jgi:hypothetical protein
MGGDLHFAGPVDVGALRQCCGRCGMELQAGPNIAVWPEGVPVVMAAGGRFASFEGVTPGMFTECGPALEPGTVPGWPVSAAQAAPFIPKRVAP